MFLVFIYTYLYLLYNKSNAYFLLKIKNTLKIKLNLILKTICPFYNNLNKYTQEKNSKIMKFFFHDEAYTILQLLNFLEIL